MNDDKPSEAEEIFSEFQKKKAEKEKPSDSAPEPEPQLSAPEPEPQLSALEPEPQLSALEPEPEPQLSALEPEPKLPEQESAKEQTSNSQKSSTQESKSAEDVGQRERNVIFVGIKPIMTYVTATLTQLSSQPTVTIKARGKRITQAVDVSQMIVKRMDSVGYVISDVRIASDSLTSQDGRQRNVSTIEIDVTKT
jgi:DNA-binding protein Alba